MMCKVSPPESFQEGIGAAATMVQMMVHTIIEVVAKYDSSYYWSTSCLQGNSKLSTIPAQDTNLAGEV